jgi:hypothetical protein
MSDAEHRFDEWIKTQKIVLREATTDGGRTWSRVTVEPTDLAREAWLESARQVASPITEDDQKAGA